VQRLRIERLHASLFKLRPSVIQLDEDQPCKVLIRVTSELCIINPTNTTALSTVSQLFIKWSHFKKLVRTGLTVDSSQLTFLPSSKPRDTKTRRNIKNSARTNLDIVA